MSEVSIGYGTTLEFAAGDPTEWIKVAKLTEIGVFNLGEIDDVEVSSHDSPDAYKEYAPGWVDAGELEITGIWTGHESQVALDDLRGQTKDWRITLPNGLGVFECRAYLKGPRINPQREDKIEFSATLRITGKPTFTA